jgi:MscS family membrane protein
VRNHVLVAVALLQVSLAGTTMAQEPAGAPAPEAAPAPPGPPPITEAEAHGYCLTPRQSWYQLLFWLQQGKRWDPAKAAACLDTAGLSDPERPGELAVMLKKVLDARALWVPVDELPVDPTYRNADGLPSHTLFREELGGIVVVRKDNRWVFSASTLQTVPALYQANVPQGIESLARSLPAPLRRYIIGVQIWQLIGILLLVLIALTVQRLVLWALANNIRKLVARIGTGWVAKALRHIDRPISALAMAGVFRLGIPLLLFPIGISRIALTATAILAAFSIVWLAYRVIDILTDWLEAKAAATETKLDDQLVPLVSKSLKVFVAVVGGMFILQNLNVDVGSLLAGLGLGGLAFALAAKDTVANFFGSVTIFVDKPFQIGDWVVIAGVEGTVEEVGFRTTRVRTFYDSLVTLPNSTIAMANVDNYGARRYRRYKTTLGLTYDTPPEKMQAFLEGVRGIIQALPGMRKDYYFVEFSDYGDFALQVMLYCFMDVPNWAGELRTKSYLNLEILRLAKELDVHFAFPTRTLHIETAPDPDAVPRLPRPVPPPGDLAKVVQAFAPGGALARPRGVEITSGYDPVKPPPVRSIDG